MRPYQSSPTVLKGHKLITYKGRPCKILGTRRGTSRNNPLDQAQWGLYHDIMLDNGDVIEIHAECNHD